jgi:hypothetical protein
LQFCNFRFGSFFAAPVLAASCCYDLVFLRILRVSNGAERELFIPIEQLLGNGIEGAADFFEHERKLQLQY